MPATEPCRIRPSPSCKESTIPQIFSQSQGTIRKTKSIIVVEALTKHATQRLEEAVTFLTD
eukprot:6198978-Pleurochrysis_carterae.AAC.1